VARCGAGMSDTAPPEGNDEDMTHTALSIARPDPVRWLWYTFGRKGALEAQHAPRPTARHLVITKVLFSAAVALSVAVGVATPVSAEPSAFGVLSCSCGGGPTAAVGGPTVSDQINDGIRDGLVNDGIRDGLADLQGVSG
jgi:hypothetical protein